MVGGKKCYALWGSFFMEKNTETKSPENPGTTPRNVCYVFLSSVVLSLARLAALSARRVPRNVHMAQGGYDRVQKVC